MTSPSDRPQARTYSGSGSLPPLTGTFKSVRVGQTPDKEFTEEQRAFIATIRNRSTSSMFVKEGDGDEIEIRPEGSYPIIRPNGISRIRLKGSGVGTAYEIRTVEAHNAFSVWDKIEGLAHSVAALLSSSGHNAAGNVPQETERIPAEGVVEVNADQTTAVPAGGSQTSTVTADSNEVWRLSAFSFKWEADSDWDGTAGDDDTQVRVETQKQGVEIAFADITTTQSSDLIEYKSGSWIGTEGTTRTNIDQNRVDDTNGINIVVDNQSSAHDMENDRTIRLAFDVIKA